MKSFFPKDSFTKRFAAKKEAQLEPGTGFDPVYPPASEMGPMDDNEPDEQLMADLRNLVEQYGVDKVRATLEGIEDITSDDDDLIPDADYPGQDKVIGDPSLGPH